jgi:hypothetical protein
MIQIPVARGLTVCEQVIIEENTKNFTLVNGFTMIRVESIPSEPRKFCIFAILSDGNGEIPLQLEIARLDTLAVVQRFLHTIEFANQTEEVRYILRLKNLRFPVAGTYQIRLTSNGEPISETVIRVTI